MKKLATCFGLLFLGLVFDTDATRYVGCGDNQLWENTADCSDAFLLGAIPAVDFAPCGATLYWTGQPLHSVPVGSPCPDGAGFVMMASADYEVLMSGAQVVGEIQRQSDVWFSVLLVACIVIGFVLGWRMAFRGGDQ